MSINLVCFCLMVLFAKPLHVVPSTWMCVAGLGWPSSWSVVRIGTASVAVKKYATISASPAALIIFLRIFDRKKIKPLKGVGVDSGFDGSDCLSLSNK